MNERDERREQHEHDVEGEDVEIPQLMAEQDQPDVRVDGVVEDGGCVVPLEQKRVLEDNRRAGEHCNRQHDDGQMRCVDDDGTPAQAKKQQVRRRGILGLADDVTQRPAGKEDEEFRGIRQREVAMREPLVEHARNVIDEDCHEGKATPEIHGIDRARHAMLQAEPIWNRT